MHNSVEHLILAPELIFCGSQQSNAAYFTYTRSGRGFRGGVARSGLLVLMVAFGASFAYAVMARVAVLVSRLQFLLGDWLGLV